MSATTQQMDGSWTELKGKLKESWGVLTDNDIDQHEGRLEQLVGAIQKRTGEARESIADKLQRLARDVKYRW